MTAPNLNLFPQVVSICKCLKGNKVALKKTLGQYLGAYDTNLWISVRHDEAILATSNEGGALAAAVEAGKMVIPTEIMRMLSLDNGDSIVMVQRGENVALKKVTVQVTEGECPRCYDVETPTTMVRVAQMGLTPAAELPVLLENAGRLRLNYSVRSFIAGRQTLESYLCRQLLDVPDKHDHALCDRLIADRLNQQSSNGSWQNNTMLTARSLKELAQLGCKADDTEMENGAQWLLGRVETSLLPGFFYLTDELARDHLRISDDIVRNNSKERFRRSRLSLRKENKPAVRMADDLIKLPCGHLVMWPTGIIVETLALLGYENDDRVHRALGTIFARNEFCEGPYAIAFGAGLASKWPDEKCMQELLNDALQQYRLRGLWHTAQLLEGYLIEYFHGEPRFNTPRIKHQHYDGYDEYDLQVRPMGCYSCMWMPMRAIGVMENAMARRCVDHLLLRILSSADFSPDKPFQIDLEQIFHHDIAALAEILAPLDSTIALSGLLKLLPLILDSQHRDGSWGEDVLKDRVTLAVTRALTSLHKRNIFVI